MDYFVVKTIHQGAVALSITGFFARGLGALVGARWVTSRAAKTLPHVRIGASLRFDPATIRAWVRGEHGTSKVVLLPGCR